MSDSIKEKSVCYAVNSDPAYTYLVQNSIRSLRKYNINLPVYLWYYGHSNHLSGFASDFNVQIIPNDEVKLDDIGMFTFLKWKAIHQVPSHRVLFMDADTIFFDDAELFFRNFGARDFYAREEIKTAKCYAQRNDNQEQNCQIDHGKLTRIRLQYGSRPTPIFNTGVMLFNNAIHTKMTYTKFQFFRNLFRDRPELYASENSHILEEIVASIVLGKISDFTIGKFSSQTTPWYIESKIDNFQNKGIAMHIWYSNYREYLKEFTNAAELKFFNLCNDKKLIRLLRNRRLTR